MTINDLRKAAETFCAAARAFDKEHKLTTVGIDGWCEEFDDVFFDIETELEMREEDEDE